MSFSIKTIKAKHPSVPVILALFTEFLFILLFGFAVLLSIEILLPTFVSARINLALCFGGILTLFMLHQVLLTAFHQNIHTPQRSFFFIFLALLGLWGGTLVLLSLIKFPPIIIGCILCLLALLGFLFRKNR